MKSTLAQSAALLLLAAGITAGSSACVDDRNFSIRQNQVPQTGCVLTTTTTIFLERGLLDVHTNLKQGYWLFPLIENLMNKSVSSETEPERNTLLIRGFDVELDLGEIPGTYPEDLLDFFTPSTGYLSPGSVIASKLKVIPDQLVQKLNIPKGIQPLVMATVRVVAERGGSTTKSAPFVYPVDLCNGCLVDWRNSCPKDDDKTILRNVCGTPQDAVVTCCQHATRGPVCYNTSTTSK